MKLQTNPVPIVVDVEKREDENLSNLQHVAKVFSSKQIWFLGASESARTSIGNFTNRCKRHCRALGNFV
jgi:hypothetical protein